MRNAVLNKLAKGSCLIAILVMAGSASVQAQYADSAAASAAEVRFQQLEKEVRRLTGQVEEQNYKIQQLQEELARQTGDLQVRIDDMQGGSTGAPGGQGGVSPQQNPSQGNSYYTPPAGGTDAPVHESENMIDAPSANQGQGSSFYTPPTGGGVDGQLGTLHQSPETGEISGANGEAAEYEAAYAYIKSRDFDGAERAFAEFIDKYPSSSYLTNAKYWYGETFYVRGNYDKSARIFAESYQANPKGSKAAGNLLKLGMSLAGLGKTEDACIAFKQLQKDYASSAVPILKRADSEMRRIGCK